ncbi:manganese catalase family protein, partial [Cronobacter sakazakii]|nr:manganese catalase family protein [Cronobacter sakazakii]
ENFEYVADPQPAVNGGDGMIDIQLSPEQQASVLTMAQRLQSDPGINPVTGAEIGASVPPVERQSKKPVEKK